jgi:hypothetical protein
VYLTLFLIVVAAAAGWYGWRHDWLRRVRRELRTLRIGSHASQATALQLEALYQMAHRPVELDVPAGPSPFEGGTWDTIGGDGAGWAGDAYYKVRGLAVHQGALFASVTGPRADGPNGHVWRFTGQNWQQAGGNVGGSWAADQSFVDHIYSMGADGLFAAEKSGVWRLHEDRWTHLCDGLELNDQCGPYGFAQWDGKLVMNQWGRPRVAVKDDAHAWSYLPDPADGWGAGVRTIYCLAEWNGALYAGTGTGSYRSASGAVWRHDGRQWEKIGGGGIRGSWSRDGIPFVLSLTPFGAYLVATLSRPAGTPGAASNVWLFDGQRWTPLAVGATPALMGQSLIMNDAIVFQDRLVVATGHDTRRPAQLWELGADQCWRAIDCPALETPGEGEGGWWVYRLCSDGRQLFASTAGHRGAARVLRFTPDTSRLSHINRET